jgi:hypothetical protein
MRVFCKGSVYVDVLNCAYGLFCLGCYCLCPCLYSTRKIVYIRIRVNFKVNTVSAVGEELFGLLPCSSLSWFVAILYYFWLCCLAFSSVNFIL